MGEHTLVSQYLTYTQATEPPRNYHRWVFLSMLGALVGRDCHIPFGPWKIYPNQYILLSGSPGARKGSAISLGKKLMQDLEFKYFGPNRAAKETMWAEMARMAGQDQGRAQESIQDEDLLDLIVDTALEAGIDSSSVAQMYICSDEFTAFTGYGNVDLFISLTALWSNIPTFYNPKLTRESVMLYNPTMNILSGTTPEEIDNAFPASIIGGGFSSRLLLIYGEAGDKIDWPAVPCEKLEELILAQLRTLSAREGPISPTVAAKELLKTIYHNTPKIMDRRFEYYYQRRHDHLLKLCMLLCLSREDEKIQEGDVLLANTTLYLAEHNMPKALGHFGKSKISGIANIVLDTIYHATHPPTFRELWKVLSQDCSKEGDLREVLINLRGAEKIQSVKPRNGKKVVYLPMQVISADWQEGLIDYNLVREEERIL